MKVSIRQISQATGFSPATVSNALNRKKGVNRATSETILKTAQEMGYQQGREIRKIKFVTYRKNGLIIDNSQIFPAMIEGVERQAKALGYETIFVHLNYEDPFFEFRLRELLEDTNGVTILLGTEMLEEDYERFRGYKGRIVILDGWDEEMDFDGVLINNTDAACSAVEYLINRGHREIGYLRGDYRIKAFQYREYGYCRALERHGLRTNPDNIVTLGTQLETAYESMKQYLGKNPKLPTAFFADNDVIALGVMKALQERKISIPDEISVIGFDDMEFSAVSVPALTTIHVFKQEMGEVAVRRALDHIQYQDNVSKMKIQVCTEFTERESVKDIS